MLQLDFEVLELHFFLTNLHTQLHDRRSQRSRSISTLEKYKYFKVKRFTQLIFHGPFFCIIHYASDPFFEIRP